MAERPSLREVMRWTKRLTLIGSALAVVYVLITLGQVWSASGRDQTREADAIVVLGAAQYDGVPSPVLAGRLDHALELYEAGWAPLIVTTGANQEGDRFTQGFAGFDYLRSRGVPEDDIVVITDGTNTYEELAATAAQADRFEIESVLLVSDGYHSFRLSQIAGELGLEAYISPTAGDPPMSRILRETAAVSIGRIVSFRRLASWS